MVLSIDVKLQFHVLSRERTQFILFIFQTDYQLDVEVSLVRQSSACHTKCDGGNILHVATFRQATQLILFIVDLQQ